MGSFSVAFGGVDTLVCSAGIGKNAQFVRVRICREVELSRH
ncbi:MAG: hypothetical protein ACXW36_09180 [Nitrospira sp.]